MLVDPSIELGEQDVSADRLASRQVRCCTRPGSAGRREGLFEFFDVAGRSTRQSPVANSKIVMSTYQNISATAENKVSAAATCWSVR